MMESTSLVLLGNQSTLFSSLLFCGALSKFEILKEISKTPFFTGLLRMTGSQIINDLALFNVLVF